MATFVQSGDSIDYTPAADVSAGAVVVQGELVGVAARAISANTLGSLTVAGVFDFPKNTATAMTAGAVVYWDATNQIAVLTSGGGTNKLIGKVVRAAAASDPVVRVRLSQ